jgi:hypothetical protein
MTALDWNNSTDPNAMLLWLHIKGKVSSRKLRHFACACCRRVWHHLADARSRTAVEAAEGFAERSTTKERLSECRAAAKAVARAAKDTGKTAGLAERAVVEATAVSAKTAAFNASFAATRAAWYATESGRLPSVSEEDVSARLPAWIKWSAPKAAAKYAELAAQAALLRDIFSNPCVAPPAIDPAWLSWNDRIILRMASAIYEERALPEGTFDPPRLAVLADALEEVGCSDADLLGHVRGPGPHVRGCFVVDAILGKA